jgi:hypothetical protein
MDFMKDKVCLDHILDVAKFQCGAEVKLLQDADKEASLSVMKDLVLEPYQLTRLPVMTNWKNKQFVIRGHNEDSIFIVDGTINQDTAWIYAFNKTQVPLKIHHGDKVNVDFLNIEELNIVEASKVVPLDSQNQTLPKIDINPDAPREARDALMKIIQKFQEEISKLPWGTNRVQHRIRLRDEFSNRCNAYVYGPKETEFQDKTTKDMLERGIVRPSNEADVSPAVVAHHPFTKKMRFCVNYQKLNKSTIRENHPMPRVWETLQKLAGSDWFSKMDLLQGFWQVPLHPDSIPLTAFISNQGIFEYLFMPFGLMNASFTFQKLMDDVLGDLKPNVAVPYIDDVGCHSKGDAMGHVHALSKVLARLLDAGLRPNWSKCRFLYQKWIFLDTLYLLKVFRLTLLVLIVSLGSRNCQVLKMLESFLVLLSSIIDLLMDIRRWQSL